MSALYMSTKRCTVAGATALCPKAMFWIFSTSMARTMSSGTGSPTPQAWLITRFVCSCASSSGAMEVSHKEPKPVFTP